MISIFQQWTVNSQTQLFWLLLFTADRYSIRIRDDFSRIRVIAGLDLGFQSPGVECMKGTMHGFSLHDMDTARMFVIEVFSEIRFSMPDTCFNVEGRRFERELRTEEFDGPSTLREIEFHPF